MAEADTSTIIALPNDPSWLRRVKMAGWVFFGIFCLLFFTVLKLPQERVKNLVQGNLAALLSTKGVSLSAVESGVSMGWGISYEMKDVTINFPPPDAPAHVDHISVKPSLLSLLTGRLGGQVWIYQGEGRFHASVSMKNTDLSASFTIKKMDIGKVGLLPVLAGVKGSAVVNGDGDISGDMNTPSTLNGSISLNLSRIQIEQQSVMGFSIPKLAIAEGVIDIDASKSKATVKTLRLGKSGSTDDLIANVTGDMTLGKQWESTLLNLKANFGLSENVTRSFALLLSLIDNAKQADGTYSYVLTGPITNVNPMPVGGGVAPGAGSPPPAMAAPQAPPGAPPIPNSMAPGGVPPAPGSVQ